ESVSNVRAHDHRPRLRGEVRAKRHRLLRGEIDRVFVRNEPRFAHVERVLAGGRGEVAGLDACRRSAVRVETHFGTGRAVDADDSQDRSELQRDARFATDRHLDRLGRLRRLVTREFQDDAIPPSRESERAWRVAPGPEILAIEVDGRPWWRRLDL